MISRFLHMVSFYMSFPFFVVGHGTRVRYKLNSFPFSFYSVRNSLISKILISHSRLWTWTWTSMSWSWVFWSWVFRSLLFRSWAGSMEIIFSIFKWIELLSSNNRHILISPNYRLIFFLSTKQGMVSFKFLIPLSLNHIILVVFWHFQHILVMDSNSRYHKPSFSHPNLRRLSKCGCHNNNKNTNVFHETMLKIYYIKCILINRISFISQA